MNICLSLQDQRQFFHEDTKITKRHLLQKQFVFFVFFAPS